MLDLVMQRAIRFGLIYAHEDTPEFRRDFLSIARCWDGIREADVLEGRKGFTPANPAGARQFRPPVLCRG